MGTILKFNTKPHETTESHCENDQGEVVIFPGVRYERHDRVKPKARKRAKPRSGTKKTRTTPSTNRSRKRNS